MARMTVKEFDKYLTRDGGRCYHCAITAEDLVPHHRLNRGSGGKNSKAEKSSNVITMCALINGLMESDADWARLARRWGWKLESWQNPSDAPVYDAFTGEWWQLSEDGQRRPALPAKVIA